MVTSKIPHNPLQIETVPPEKANICAVIVTFNPQPGFEYRLEAITRQVQCVVICDNGSKPPILNSVSYMLGDDRVVLLENPTNLGIVTALNQGIRYALSRGYRWVLFFDDDSLPMAQMVDTFRAIYEAYEFKKRLAIIGSYGSNAQRTNPGLDQACESQKLWIETDIVIGSGTLVSGAVFDRVGYLREPFFMDHYDHEFCFRVRAHGLKVLRTAIPLIEHKLANATATAFLGRQFWPSNAAAWRWYYMVRNLIFLIREYYPGEASCLRHLLWVQVKWMIKVILFEHQKLEKLNYALLGLMDGFRNRFQREVQGKR